MRIQRLGILIGSAAIVAALTSGVALAADAEFVGQAKCKMCHANEHKAWAASKHANAFNVLKPEDQAKPECLSCHTTGQGKTAAAGADLKGVQCEACHGAGSAYKATSIMSKSKYAADKDAAHAAAMAAGLVVPDEATCKSCHNEKSPTFKGFDFAAMKEKIKHWK
jgi:hypothetical protein